MDIGQLLAEVIENTPWEILLSGVFGALIGAVGAFIVARQTRADAREAREQARDERFADTVRDLAGQFIRAAGAYHREVAAEFVWRHDAENAPWPAARKPIVGSLEPLAEIEAELHITVTRQETADAAHGLYIAAVELSEFAFQPDVDLVDGMVTPISDKILEVFRDFERQFDGAIDEFIQAMRGELGRKPFERIDVSSLPPGRG